jgi:hypothetical protein
MVYLPATGCAVPPSSARQSGNSGEVGGGGAVRAAGIIAYPDRAGDEIMIDEVKRSSI